ncbi:MULTISPECIES: hypothetical protein [Pseudomonas]|uniref:hypothetical protein n=1 Tax=Pseudomonas TaxID=286 RepID=UPI000F55C4B7|nr:MULTISPECIES: hypothetical protein [Pseudomonas]AZF10381.1 hypothetical protein C4J93_2183 [Pseudomonas sp. R2-37-08W]AZF15607.1 hypothetical protein C4J92_2123 [Pseudomonas sp. R3-18-08]AZF31618.1 hypothetical protein C4J89_2143 [Pseudomonas sp. R4-35-07]AZF36893.1 hypothetical protein C4J88_2110 [Pseudomonas sp. R4-39-08]AZF52560.1 hypothetical protein C4J85_2075 [Pseudomonas sp. R4-34-07]
MEPVAAINEILLSNERTVIGREDTRRFLRLVSDVHNTTAELVFSGKTPTVGATIFRLVTLALSSISLSAGSWLGPPGALATPLSNPLSDDLFKTHIESFGFDVVSKGFESLEGAKREFLTRTINNGISVVTSVIESLKGIDDPTFDAKLTEWGVDPSIRPRLLENYRAMQSMLLWMTEEGGQDIYLVEPYDNSDPTAAINLVQDGEQRIAFSLQFFKKCAIPAVNALLHEVAHLCCNKFDFYYFSREKSCLDDQYAELPLHRQIKDFARGFEQSSKLVAEHIEGEEFLSAIAPKDNTKTLTQLYNEDADTKVMVNFMNADSVSALAIVIADYNLHHDGNVPLKETSSFKSPPEAGLYVES